MQAAKLVQKYLISEVARFFEWPDFQGEGIYTLQAVSNQRFRLIKDGHLPQDRRKET